MLENHNIETSASSSFMHDKVTKKENFKTTGKKCQKKLWRKILWEGESKEKPMKNALTLVE